MKEFERIIVGTDGSLHADSAVKKAIAFALLTQRPLVAVYVVEPMHLQSFTPETLAADMTNALRTEARNVLTEVEARAKQAGVDVKAIVREGRPAEEICNEATERDLIVVATHGRRGLGRMLLGSVAENVVRHAPCPVLVIRDKSRKKGHGD